MVLVLEQQLILAQTLISMVVLHLVPALIKQQAAPRLNAVLSVLPSPTKQLARHQLVLRQPRRVSLLALQEKLKPLVQLRIPAPLHVQPASTQMLPASALLGLSVVTQAEVPRAPEPKPRLDLPLPIARVLPVRRARTPPLALPTALPVRRSLMHLPVPQ
jgi:hypothetical protein